MPRLTDTQRLVLTFLARLPDGFWFGSAVHGTATAALARKGFVQRRFDTQAGRFACRLTAAGRAALSWGA